MLPRAGRLRHTRDFERVYRNGRRVSMESFTIYVHSRGDDAPTRIGFVVGRRFGTQVARNRVKRRLRAVARALWPRLPHGYDIVCIARPPAATAPIDTLHEQFQRALQQGGVR
jgi:ribonuclease P protein component